MQSFKPKARNDHGDSDPTYGNGWAILKTRNQITGAEFIRRGDESTFFAEYFAWHWSESKFSCQQPNGSVRAVGISMIPGLIAKTSRFPLEKYPAYSSGHVVPEF